MAAAAGAASGVDASEASSLAHFSHSASEVKVHDRHLLHLRVEDENTLSHAELEEQKFFSECGSSMKTIIIAMHCVDGTIHRHLETRKNIARLHFYFETVLINALILVATTSVLMQTVRQFDPHCTEDKIQSRRSVCTGHEWEHFWYYTDHACFALFTMEWLFRMCGSVYIGRGMDHWRDPMNWIDLISIIPFYTQRLLHNYGTDLRFVRAARLARITSSLKTMRFGNMNQLIADIVNNSIAALIIPLYFMSLSAIVFGAFMYHVEGGTLYCCEFDRFGHVADSCEVWVTREGFAYGDCGAVNKPQYQSIMLAGNLDVADAGFDSIPAGIWWCFVTFTTVGYGDISPSTAYGKLLNIVAMFLGVFFFAMPVAIIGDSFVHAWKNKKMKDNALFAKRLLIAGHWQPDLKRLGQVRQDMDVNARAMRAKINEFRNTRPPVEQIAWDNLNHALSAFNNEFGTVWSYYNVDVEQLRKEMQHKLDDLKKLERTNSQSDKIGKKMTNPLHLDSTVLDSDSEEDGESSPLSPEVRSSRAAVQNPMLRDSVHTLDLE